MAGHEAGRSAVVAAGAVAGAVAALSLRVLREKPPGGSAVWDRTNHAGRTVTLLEGPAYAVGAAAGAALLGAGPGPVLAASAAAGLGALDDLTGDSSSKGLKGHLGALARGNVTTGAVKILGLAVTGLVSAALIDREARRDATAGSPSVLDTLVAGAVVAGSANLLNLLDLRPGRALKATIGLGALLSTSRRSGPAAGAAVGAAAGLLRPDLAGEAMLGDTGANSAGALLGTALVQRTGRRGRWLALAVLTALTLASEKVSFTKVIESTPGLRELDALGRR
jgi:UDP-N-acetylmuramyl pentapeptide phosphotransferase/UDP-N-acetylglucosamine-1-phosphate transferase